MPRGFPGKPVCSVPGCSSLNDSRGLCSKHYRRHRIETGEIESSLGKSQTCQNCGANYEFFRPKKYCSRTCRARKNVRDAKASGSWVPPTSEARRQYAKTYYSRNRAKVLARTARYASLNKHVYTATKLRRRASGRSEVRSKDLSRLLMRTAGCCSYCNRRLALTGVSCDLSLNWDHVVPASRGGVTSIGNLVPSCRKCNLEKRAMFIMEWRIRGQWFIKTQ